MKMRKKKKGGGKGDRNSRLHHCTPAWVTERDENEDEEEEEEEEGGEGNVGGRGRRKSSMEKWLILGLGHVIYKSIFITEGSEGQKKSGQAQ